MKKIARQETASGQESAQYRADRERERGDPRPRTDRLAALSGRKGVRDDRERRGHHERAADSLDDAASDQPGRVRREPRGGRRNREQHYADQERQAPSKDVAEAATRRQEDGEGERVAVDDPLEARQAGAQIALDRWQRHVDDRVVEHDHEQREAHGAERPPLAIRVGDQACLMTGHEPLTPLISLAAARISSLSSRASSAVSSLRR